MGGSGICATITCSPVPIKTLVHLAKTISGPGCRP